MKRLAAGIALWILLATPALAKLQGELPVIKRVVALSPALAEVVAEIFEGRVTNGYYALVGVTDYADTPEAVRSLPSVGPYSRVSLEKVIALKPDLILATEDGNAKDQIERLRGLGKLVVVIQTRDLEEVARSFEIIGAVLNLPEAGSMLATRFRQELAVLEAEVQKRPLRILRRVALQLGDDPLIFVGRKTFTADLVHKMGYAPIFQEFTQTYPRPSREHLLAHPPKEIWVLALGKDLKVFEKMRDRWLKYSFKDGRKPTLRVIPADDWVRPTPRLLRAARLIVEYGRAEVAE